MLNVCPSSRYTATPPRLQALICFVADAALSDRVPLFARSGHKAAMARVGVGQQHPIIGT